MTKDPVVIALIVAIGSGMGMAVLGALNSTAGRLVSPLGTGLIVNILAGVLAGLTLLVFRQHLPQVTGASFRAAMPYLIISALLGIGTLTGISFSLARIGVAAGLASLIMGQMLLAVIMDTAGWNGTGQIPLTLARVAGLALLLVATWLLLPNTLRP